MITIKQILLFFIFVTTNIKSEDVDVIVDVRGGIVKGQTKPRQHPYPTNPDPFNPTEIALIVFTSMTIYLLM
jgi:hypothetical protein